MVHLVRINAQVSLWLAHGYKAEGRRPPDCQGPRDLGLLIEGIFNSRPSSPVTDLPPGSVYKIEVGHSLHEPCQGWCLVIAG